VWPKVTDFEQLGRLRDDPRLVIGLARVGHIDEWH
jgi:hypothetical protein